MDDEVDQLRTELESPDEGVRNWAAFWAGNHGVAAVPLLPKLLEMRRVNLLTRALNSDVASLSLSAAYCDN